MTNSQRKTLIAAMACERQLPGVSLLAAEQESGTQLRLGLTRRPGCPNSKYGVARQLADALLECGGEDRAGKGAAAVDD